MKIGKESETVEFKESAAELRQGIESISAILNKGGSGELLFGVKDTGEVKGQPISDSTIKTVSDAIMRDIEPKIVPTIEVAKMDGKDVLRVKFCGNQQPYSAFGKFLVRVGSQNRHMTRDELRKLFMDEDYSYPWEKAPSDIVMGDIDDVSLKRFYDEAIGCGRLNMRKYSKEGLLTLLELRKGGKIVNAGNALFGKNPGIGLKTACYATNEKMTFTDLNSVKGNIYSLIDLGVQYILNHINWRVSIDMKRNETPEIPVAAIREIVVNAFAHAMYNPLPEIEIDIFPGKVTIYNPGSFPDDLNPEDFVEKDMASIKRNPLILDVLYRCKDVEKSGSGFKRVDELCRAYGVSWESYGNAYGFYFTFHRKNVTLNVTLDGTLDGTLDSDIPGNDGLSILERKVLAEIENNSKVTREEIALATGKSVRSIQRATNSLVEKKRILRVGNNRFGYWQILQK